MAEHETLARPYAKAAFDVARGAGDDGPARWDRYLQLLAAAMETDEAARMVASPAMPPAPKAERLAELLADELDDHGRRFLRLLAENKRLMLLPEIHEQYAALRAEWERTLEVEVVSAYELDADDADRLQARLAERYDRRVSMTHRVDGALIGGAVIRAGDTVIDGSVRGRLSRLAEQLRVRL